MATERAAFVHLADFFWGPDTATPLVPFAVGVPCRFVPQTKIAGVAVPLDSAVAYLTVAATAPHAPTFTQIGNTLSIEMGTFDVITVSARPGWVFRVVAIERMLPADPDGYWRAYLAIVSTP